MVLLFENSSSRKLTMEAMSILGYIYQKQLKSLGPKNIIFFSKNRAAFCDNSEGSIIFFKPHWFMFCGFLKFELFLWLTGEPSRLGASPLASQRRSSRLLGTCSRGGATLDSLSILVINVNGLMGRNEEKR